MSTASITIVPAILTARYEDLQRSLTLMQGVAPLVQVDVVDGVFAAHKTWPYVDGEGFGKIVAGDEGLPFWEDFDFQFDLMVANPQAEAARFVAAGASSIVVHAHSNGALSTLQELQSARDGEITVSVGVAVLPVASVEDLKKFGGLYDFVQVMGIGDVGAQGQPFDQRALALVAALRQVHPDMPIQVDGGVSLHNARALTQAGATRLVCGSAIFSTPDPRTAYEMLYNEANA